MARNGRRDLGNGYQNVKKVITNCPHCFNTIKNEFPQFGGDYEVLHATELVAQLLDEGKIKTNGEGGRIGGFPRFLLPGPLQRSLRRSACHSSQLSGVDLREPERNRNNGMCCGAGGGRMWIEEDPNQRVNSLRVQQLLDTEATTIASGCPYCMTMLDDGVKGKGPGREHQDP